jgi:hypothetical protein
MVFPVEPRIAAPGKPLPNQFINKHPDMLSRILGYVFGMVAELLKEFIYGVLPVEEFPYVDTGRAQAKTMTAVGVEENGPVVELLPEHDVRVGYGFFTVFHRTDTGSLRFKQYSCQERHH